MLLSVAHAVLSMYLSPMSVRELYGVNVFFSLYDKFDTIDVICGHLMPLMTPIVLKTVQTLLKINKKGKILCDRTGWYSL